MTDDISDKEIEIENYEIIRCDSNSRHTGGVAIFVKNDLKWKLISKRHRSKSWGLVISVDDRFMHGRFGVVYKSPKEKINDFLEFLDDFLDDSICLESRNIIFGDMNLNVGKKSKNVKKYLSAIENHGLQQCVNLPTRVTTKSSTVIDHILTNIEKINWNLNTDSPVDHYMLEIFINSQKRKDVDRRKIKYTCWKNYSPEKLREKLNNIEWKSSQCVNEKAYDMCKNLKEVIASLVTKKEKPARHFNNKWFSSKVAGLKKQVKNARDKFMYTNNQEDQNEINRLLREYKSAIIDAKNEFTRNQFEKNRKDCKKLWKTLKSLYSDKSLNLGVIEFADGEICDDNLVNANRLNHHIAESISSIVRNINTPSQSCPNFTNDIPLSNSLFDLCEITFDDLARILKDLKQKTFDDQINGRVLSDAMSDEGFAKQLLSIVNDSIRQSTMPDEFKSSIVTPIPKVPAPKKPDDL